MSKSCECVIRGVYTCQRDIFMFNKTEVLILIMIGYNEREDFSHASYLRVRLL